MKSSLVILLGLITAIQGAIVGNIFTSVSNQAIETAQKIINDTKQTIDLVQGHVKEDINKALTLNVLGTVQTIADNAFETTKTIADNAIATAQKITNDALDDAMQMIPILGRPLVPTAAPITAQETSA